MVDINRHKFLLVQILKDIYNDIELANSLGFKGGTALMLFYDLPRFSVDLDFNLLDPGRQDSVYEKARKIVMKYGSIHDEAKKFHGLLIVLDYGSGERKLKIEISNRGFKDSYEVKNLLGINMRVMVQEDMFAHKLCALLDRRGIIARDIFDCWFFMQRRTPLNISIVESRMEMPLSDYLQKCNIRLQSINRNVLLRGMGELMDENVKIFVRTKLHSEIIGLFELYKKFPIIG